MKKIFVAVIIVGIIGIASDTVFAGGLFDAWSAVVTTSKAVEGAGKVGDALLGTKEDPNRDRVRELINLRGKYSRQAVKDLMNQAIGRSEPDRIISIDSNSEVWEFFNCPVNKVRYWAFVGDDLKDSGKYGVEGILKNPAEAKTAYIKHVQAYQELREVSTNISTTPTTP